MSEYGAILHFLLLSKEVGVNEMITIIMPRENPLGTFLHIFLFRNYRGGAFGGPKPQVHFSTFDVFRGRFLCPPIYSQTFFAISDNIMIQRTSKNQKVHVTIKAGSRKGA